MLLLILGLKEKQQWISARFQTFQSMTPLISCWLIFDPYTKISKVLDLEITTNYLKISQAPSCFDTKLSKVKFLKHQHELDMFHDFWQAFE